MAARGRHVLSVVLTFPNVVKMDRFLLIVLYAFEGEEGRERGTERQRRIEGGRERERE